MGKVFVFDLDNTLYPQERGLWKIVDGRIEKYVETALNVDRETARNVRKGFLKVFGTTLKGLVINHDVDPDDYLEYVHDVDVEGILDFDGELLSVLEGIPFKKFVFTNAPGGYAGRVIESLGVSDCFVEILDINFMDHIAKPSLYPFRKLVSYLGVPPGEVIFFDDVDENVKAARRVGINSVLVSPNGVREERGLVIGNIKNIPDIMEKLDVAKYDW